MISRLKILAWLFIPVVFSNLSLVLKFFCSVLFPPILHEGSSNVRLKFPHYARKVYFKIIHNGARMLQYGD